MNEVRDNLYLIIELFLLDATQTTSPPPT